MRELTLKRAHVHFPALDAALRAALPNKLIGVSGYAGSDALRLWLEDSATDADFATARAVVETHNPVFLSADKTTIAEDDTDLAIVTVRAPAATEPTLTVLIGGQPIPIALINGTGTLRISSADPAVIAIRLQNPANRTTDEVRITAE